MFCLQPISGLGNHLIPGGFREMDFSNWFCFSTCHVWTFSPNVSMNSFILLTDSSWRSFHGNQMPYLLNHPLHKAQVVENRHHTSEENNDWERLQQEGRQDMRNYIVCAVCGTHHPQLSAPAFCWHCHACPQNRYYLKSKNTLDQCVTKNKTGSFYSICQENLKWKEKGRELG